MKKKFYTITFALVIILSSCSGGGNSSAVDGNQEPQVLNIYSSPFPSEIYSYDPVQLNISSNYPDCVFNVTSPYIYWIEKLNNEVNFNAPITFQDNETIPITIRSIPSDL